MGKATWGSPMGCGGLAGHPPHGVWLRLCCCVVRGFRTAAGLSLAVIAVLLLRLSPLAAQPAFREDTLHGRKAFVLENGLIRAGALRGGGHLGEIRFLSDDPKKSLNPMYVPDAPTMEPYEWDPVRDRDRFRTAFSAGYMGHMLCFPSFGPPSSPEEARNGLAGHGEAGTVEWKPLAPPLQTPEGVVLRYGGELPKTQYRVERTITLPAGESVLYIEEIFENLVAYDRPYNRDGHATFGMPFVDLGKSFFDTSARKGMIQVRANQSLLSGREITWPEGYAPDGGPAGLRGIQPIAGTNTYYAVAADPSREWNYFTLYNSDYPILIGFLLPTQDHPWIVDWQNNQGDRFTRGIEFGTSPFDEGLRKSVERGSLLGIPAYGWINGRGKVTVRYAIFLAEIPIGFQGVEDVETGAGRIVIVARQTGRRIPLAATRLTP